MAARNAQPILSPWLPSQWSASTRSARHGQTLQRKPLDSSPDSPARVGFSRLQPAGHSYAGDHCAGGASES